jgi:hypothetical protein
MFANKNPYDLRMLKDSVYTVVHKNKLSHDGPTYHVHIDQNTNTWQVTCIGIECVDSHYTGTYYTNDKVPDKLVEKVTVLLMVEPQANAVAGVGLRASTNTFWVYM